MGQNQSGLPLLQRTPSQSQEAAQQNGQNYRVREETKHFSNSMNVSRINSHLHPQEASIRNQSPFYSNNQLSQSIPNLRNFQEQREQVQDSQLQLHESPQIQKPTFVKQQGKHLRKEENYKKSLHSAMTSRVLRQQNDHNSNVSASNKSLVLQSQRSFTSLDQGNSKSVYFSRAQSPMQPRPSQYPDLMTQKQQEINADGSYTHDFHNPKAMKKQYSHGNASNKKSKQNLKMQDHTLSTQAPFADPFNPNEQQFLHSYTPQGQALGLQRSVDSQSFTKVFKNQDYQQASTLNERDFTSRLQQQLLRNYEKAKHLKQQPSQFPQNSAILKNGLPPLPHQVRSSQNELYSQDLNSVQSDNNQNFAMQSNGSHAFMLSQVSNQAHPPYKIKRKSQRGDQMAGSQMMRTSSMIKREIQFGGSNCMLDPLIAMTILQYDMGNFRKYLCLSPQWHHLVLEGMDEHLKKVEVEFVMKYYEHLFFKKSYTNSSTIHFCGRKGLRVDRVIVCEVLNNKQSIGKCLRASYGYKYCNNQSHNNEYVADFKLDVVKPNTSRLLWVHKDQQEQLAQQRQYQFNEEIVQLTNRPYVQPVTQICAKDTIEITVNIFSMQGLVDIDSIEWFEPDFLNAPKVNVLTYNKDMRMKSANDNAQKIYCDLSRICEVEDEVVEWYDSKYFQRPSELLNLDFLAPLFNIKKFECAGVEGLICKVQLQAAREGRLVHAFIGLPLVVKDTNKQSTAGLNEETGLVNEVKRLGLLIDRYVDLELRVGDTLVLYISRASA